MSNEYYIDTPADLAAFCDRLKSREWIALDTEFLREKTYYPQLCLIQVGIDDHIACIDPLAIADLGPLLELLYDPRITKVLHAATQDLEIFYHLRGEVPAPVFDTQVAASVLGLGEQIGYGKLVSMLLDVQLSKSHARTDWSLRPLEPEQLRYAEDDVRYLCQLYPRMVQTLTNKGRMTWIGPELHALADPRRYAFAPATAWQRVRGTQHLRGQQLAILRALAGWREREAERLNKPRKWILQDEVLVELARRAPTAELPLAKVRGMELSTVRRIGEDLIAIIKTALQEPEESWPALPERHILTLNQEALVDAAMAVLRLCAQENNISPGAISSRKELELLVSGETDLPLLQGWKAQVAGNKLLALTQGQLRLQVENGQLRLVTDTSSPR